MIQEYPIVIEQRTKILDRLLEAYDKGYSDGYLEGLKAVMTILDDMKEKLYA